MESDKECSVAVRADFEFKRHSRCLVYDSLRHQLFCNTFGSGTVAIFHFDLFGATCHLAGKSHMNLVARTGNSLYRRRNGPVIGLIRRMVAIVQTVVSVVPGISVVIDIVDRPVV